jgi:Tol biopolymer transport system component
MPNLILEIKMRKAIFGIIIGACLLPAAQKSDRAEMQLQAAINKEVVEGDLKGAIEQYKKIAQGANRPVAAKALVHMGECYERLGDAEARTAYERVIRDFSDQKEVLAEASGRLASLGGPQRRGPVSVSMRRVGTDLDDEGAPSPDGRWLSYVTSNQDLGLYNLLTGEKRLLTHNPSGVRQGAEESIWSPDGKQIAYGWDCASMDCVELRLIRPDGSGDRLLYRDEKLSWIMPFDWSPDGESISVALTYKEGHHALALVQVQSATVRVLRRFDRHRNPQEALFSPDGRYVAYEVPGPSGENERDIWLTSLDGVEAPLAPHPADDRVVAWTPEGLLFASDRTGSMDLWLQPVAGGKSQGLPRRVKPDIGRLAGSLGLTRSGALYYSVHAGINDIHLVSLDPATGTVASEPRPATQRHAGSNAWPAWSTDGKRLAYTSASSNQRQVFSVQDLATGEERDLKPPLSRIRGFRWAPDGRSLVASGMTDETSCGIFRLDAQTGAATPLVMAGEGSLVMNPQLSPDGKTLFYSQNHYAQANPTQALKAYDLTTRVSRVVTEDYFGGASAAFSLSPDGQTITFMRGEKQGSPFSLWVTPAAGGEPRKLLQAAKPGAARGNFVTWWPDGRSILYMERRDEKSPFELWRIPASGGQPESLGLSGQSLTFPQVQPDRKQIAFNTGNFRDRIEIWVLENFLPAAPAAR